MLYSGFIGLGKKARMKAVFLQIVAAFGIGLAIVTSGQAIAEPGVQQVSQFSGKPVPRFESLRYSAVHGRQGPSLDHPILWRYEREGLPMLIVRETHGWRRVRDKDGDEVWMQARMLSADPKVVLTAETVMRRKPDADAAGQAKIGPGVIADLQSCDRAYCKIKVDGLSGWVPSASVWGVETESAGL